ncbi:MAG: monovalent cation/H(+) antiporter subunit G [Pseudomonadota bacterium]|uniref:monovalent cation/H(+) antiporter subunit G n=1 Tax=Phenylobacterium sp. TaxID=1871053 RepID=UPI00271FF6D3|nr:monovalent cation/H(+) antiporter subunit G [Phenylobacterium sp.]MDO9432329.1 monovalent cation/H(+) antiporter subunit G [Phenylobacterium sp.]
MTPLAELPLWASILVSALLLLGALLAFTGSFGLLHLNSFYKRVHAPTLGTTLGAFCILAGSIAYFSVSQSRPVLHEVLIGVFLSLTTPITLMLLVRAALYRDREEGSPDVPHLDLPE